MASNLFSWGDFKKYYFATSTYAKKTALADSFFHIWFNTFGSMSLGGYPSYARVKTNFNPTTKKKFKTQLIAKGYSSAAIDGLYKCLSTWINANT